MSEITNPHDKLFKEIEKVKENSRDPTPTLSI